MKSGKGLKIPEYLKANLDKYKYILMICALGLVLVLWPWGGKAEEAPVPEAAQPSGFYYDVDALAAALSQAFEAIEGVGQAKVLLTVKSGYEQVYVYDQTSQTSEGENQRTANVQTQLVTVSGGGEESPVVRRINYPVFMGAVVICEGGGSAKVQLELTQAVKSLTGISADNIVITKMKQ